jgi:hypothetical protein
MSKHSLGVPQNFSDENAPNVHGQHTDPQFVPIVNFASVFEYNTPACEPEFLITYNFNEYDSVNNIMQFRKRITSGTERAFAPVGNLENQ